MEHISEILKRQARTSTSKENTDTWSSADAETAQSTECPVCKGARFVHPRLPSGKPDYSSVVPCRCVKTEQAEERQSRLKQYSNLGSLARFTFDNLMPEGRSSHKRSQEQFAHACQAARAFAVQPRGWLVLGGPSGSGKTIDDIAALPPDGWELNKAEPRMRVLTMDEDGMKDHGNQTVGELHETLFNIFGE